MDRMGRQGHDNGYPRTALTKAENMMGIRARMFMEKKLAAIAKAKGEA